MKLRVSDRILVALAGLVLLTGCAGVIAQAFFQVDLLGKAARVLNNSSLPVRVALIAGIALLLVLGIYCVLVLFRHRGRSGQFVLQKTENGELSISVKALESMVAKCLEPHPEVSVDTMQIETRKDGLLIRLAGNTAGGISIPLTVEALQREIKQYVTACSGLEIKSILVEIQSSGEPMTDVPFPIEAPAPRALLKEENTREEEGTAPEEPAGENRQEAPREKAPEPAAEKAQAAPAPAVMEEEDDDRPLHQRLFKPVVEPCIVPEPPAGPEAPVEGEPAMPEAPGAGNGQDGASAAAGEAADGEPTQEETENKKEREAFQASQHAFDRVVTGGAEEEKGE